MAFPFSDTSFSARKPPNPAYPTTLVAIGDHIRRHWLDLGLFQKEVAKRIEWITDTIATWELNRTEPEARC